MKESMQGAIRRGNIVWRMHCLSRLAERGILQNQVLDVLRNGEEVERYEESKPFPCALFLGFPEGKPVHVVAAFDNASDAVHIITVYEPDEEHFEPDYRTRRK